MVKLSRLKFLPLNLEVASFTFPAHGSFILSYTFFQEACFIHNCRRLISRLPRRERFQNYHERCCVPVIQSQFPLKKQDHQGYNSGIPAILVRMTSSTCNKAALTHLYTFTTALWYWRYSSSARRNFPGNFSQHDNNSEWNSIQFNSYLANLNGELVANHHCLLKTGHLQHYTTKYII